METQIAHPTPSALSEHEFTPGTPVVYALHGRCNVVGVETRQIAGEAIRFYKLEMQKSALSRSTRQEPAIWLPVNSARDRGLRSPMTAEVAEKAFAILSTREYYFQPSEAWSIAQPKLEACIRAEGAIGLAKVASFLHVLKRKLIVPSAEIARFHESVSKLLYRELSETLQQPIRGVEERIQKGLRQKLIPDS